jgi:hypothetical protein
MTQAAQRAKIEPAFKLASKDFSIVVTFGVNAELLHLHLEDDALKVSSMELNARIMLLSTWARLRVQHANGLTTADELAEFERLIDF